MTVYLASPRTQQQAEHLSGMPVLVSFGCFSPCLRKGYLQSFDRVLVDSGAFGELNSGIKIDLEEYRAFSGPFIGRADAIAGLDDISGDWRRSLRNYAAIDWTFPTWHNTDPLELLPELCAMAVDRGKWLGIGLKPPRENKETIIRQALEMVPESLHVHLWAGRAYTHIRRIDSVDSTNIWLDAMKLRKNLPWLTYGECIAIVVKRYQRWNRNIAEESTQMDLIA